MGANGGAVLNNLVVRNSLVVGSVSDGGTVTTAAAHTKTNNQVSVSNNLGIFTSDNFWTIAWSVEYRHIASSSSYYITKGSSGYAYTITPTLVKAQYRIKKAGVWGPWITEEQSPQSTSITTYDVFSTTKVMIGDYDDVELRIQYGVLGPQSTGTVMGNVATQNNTKSVSTIGKAITR